jgi:hypothetical protein
MAARPQLRRKTTWPGFFSNTMPVRALPSAHLDEDAEVYQRVKHLQHLRAVQDALDETDVRNTRPGYNPQLDDLFGDPLADRSRFTDVFGNQLGIGQTLDSLLGKYGTDNVPGEHNEDPGSARGSSRTGMASQEGPDDEEVALDSEATMALADLAVFERSVALLHEIVMQRRNAESARGTVAALLGSALPGMRGVVDQMYSKFNEQAEYFQKREEEQYLSIYDRWGVRLSLPEEKPRPDDAGGRSPTPRELSEIRKLLVELQTWGNPSADFKLGRTAVPYIPAQALVELRKLRNGGGPSVYDRLGNMEKQRRQNLTANELRQLHRRLKIGNLAINWGDQGPPTPPTVWIWERQTYRYSARELG